MMSLIQLYIKDEKLIIPGGTLCCDTDGATEGSTDLVEFVASVFGGIGGGALDICSLSHNSAQLVFQKPIFVCSRSYKTRVFRTTIPVQKNDIGISIAETYLIEASYITQN